MTPEIKIKKTTTDTLIEAIGWLTLVVLWSLAIFSYAGLPDIIPIHFKYSGQPDNYGSKNLIFILPILGTILFVGMTVLNKYPHMYNYPGAITIENAQKQYTRATRMIRYLKVAIILIFTVLVVFIQKTATGKTEGLDARFLPVTVGLLFLPTIFFVITSYKTKE